MYYQGGIQKSASVRPWPNSARRNSAHRPWAETPTTQIRPWPKSVRPWAESIPSGRNFSAHERNFSAHGRKNSVHGRNSWTDGRRPILGQIRIPSMDGIFPSMDGIKSVRTELFRPWTEFQKRNPSMGGIPPSMDGIDSVRTELFRPWTDGLFYGRNYSVRKPPRTDGRIFESPPATCP